MSDRLPPIQIAGSELACNGHICALFNDADELYRLLLPFVRDGVEQGDKSLHVIAPAHIHDHCQRLRTAQIDVDAATRKGLLDIRDWHEIYLPDGRFDQRRMLELLRDHLTQYQKDGFARARVIACAEWAAESHEGVHDLIEYEARYNLIHREQDAVICVYDTRLFSPAMIAGVLHTHPTILMNGILQKNPLYIPPDEFLKRYTEKTVP